MKVLALNSSPRKDGQSKTKLMLNALVEGMRDAGAAVDVVDLRTRRINPCIGCFTCWTKTPGLCVHRDDMSQDLYPRWLAADLVVYATPLYAFTLSASMKSFIERTIPFLQPFFKDEGGSTMHYVRRKPPLAVVVSVAGFPEMSVFDQLSSYVRYLFGLNNGLVAEIYRPLAEVMKTPFVKEKADDILDATRQAGREIVEARRVSPETMARITQDIIADRQIFMTMGNLMWKTCIAEGVTPEQFEERGLIPRPDSIEAFLMVMEAGFNRDAGRDTKAVFQFNFTGEAEGACMITIAEGKISGKKGAAGKPDVTVQAPFDIWMDIITGKADGGQMFLDGKYRAEGDINLLMKMKELFGRTKS